MKTIVKMRTKYKLLTLVTILGLGLGISQSAQAQQTLLLVGGGNRPTKALQEWIQARPQTIPKVMIITWASAGKKEQYETSITQDLKNIGVKDFLYSREVDAGNKNQFLNELSLATHIFFSGGNQKLIMQTLQDVELMKAVQDVYWKKAIPIAGTSAGTAVQAELMMVGDGQPLEKGLGFLPKSVIDQHFFKRGREERLRQFMKQAPVNFVGLGVDEDGSILLKRNPKTKIFQGKVIGEKNVLFVGALTKVSSGSDRDETVLKPNQKIKIGMCKNLF